MATSSRLLPVIRGLPIEVIQEHARLDGVRADARLTRAISSVQRTLTMDGANLLTLTLEDEAREVLRSRLLEGRVLLDLPDEGVWVWDRSRDIGGLTVNGSQSALRMWCIASGTLRAQTAALSKSASKLDLGGWVATLARERAVLDAVPGLRTVVPNRDGSLPATKRPTSTVAATRSGFKNPPKSIPIYNGRLELTSSRLAIAARLLTVAERLKATRRSKLALLMAGIVESNLSNPTTITDPGSTSLGTLQAQYGVSAGPKGTITKAQANDVDYCAEAFLAEPGFASRGGALKLAAANPNWSPGTIAWNVEMPATQHRGRYDQCRKGADQLLDAWSGSGGSSGGQSVEIPSTWRRGNGGDPESSWTCLKRYADQLGRRRFIALPTSARPRLVVAADQALILAAPHLTLNGLDDRLLQAPPTIELEGIKTAQTINLVAWAEGWSAPPGSVVNVRESGPVNGPWLVQRLEQDNVDPLVRVTLQQPTTKVQPVAAKSTAGGKSSASSSEGVQRVYDEALQISKAGGPYKYGGGHGAQLSGLQSGQGLDCSSSSSLALYRAKQFGSRTVAIVSGGFASSFGVPGRGNKATVWANVEHVWIEFHGIGTYSRFDTSPHGDGPSGPRMRKTKRSTSGFTPRHLSGW